MKKSLMILSLISMCSQANAMEGGPNSLFRKLGSACATFRANPLRTVGHAGFAVARYVVCTTGGFAVGAAAGGCLGAEAIKGRGNSDSLIGLPIVTGIGGGIFGAGMGILCAYKSKNIWSGMSRFGARAKNDFMAGSRRDRNS